MHTLWPGFLTPFLLPNMTIDAINTNLLAIAAHAEANAQLNDSFKVYLKQQPPAHIDALVQELNQRIEPQIDCKQCGNCCKSLLINVSNSEADALSTHLQRSRTDFDNTYLEKSSNGSLMVMNAVPCAFLQQNSCSVYEHRFAGCREFPAMHLPQFTKRLFTTFMHYERCPIVFNVVEHLKTALHYTSEEPSEEPVKVGN